MEVILGSGWLGDILQPWSSLFEHSKSIHFSDTAWSLPCKNQFLLFGILVLDWVCSIFPFGTAWTALGNSSGGRVERANAIVRICMSGEDNPLRWCGHLFESNFCYYGFNHWTAESRPVVYMEAAKAVIHFSGSHGIYWRPPFRQQCHVDDIQLTASTDPTIRTITVQLLPSRGTWNTTAYCMVIWKAVKPN